MKLALTAFLALLGLQGFGQPIKRYFGLHFDFHANATDRQVGQRLSEPSLDSLLTAVKPDFIQVDCKGHPGLSSYPSRLAMASTVKPFGRDPLAFYRAVTRKHGVALYLHYSGVFDEAAIARHPAWAAIRADGSIDRAKTSVHGPYADSLLIPQLNELADYGADGVWVDGECWATVPDYSPAALAKFRAETGLTSLPRSDKDPSYGAFRAFTRQSFVRYLNHYVDAVHRQHPTFRIASNWAYSSMMPEPITTRVDYLSGDLTPGNSVNSAALEGRALAAQGQLYGKPWDLMSWSFWYDFNRPGPGDQKTAVHLMQDAAEVLALGGGFQAYYQQSRNGALPLRELPVMVELSRFVRARQPFCEGSVPVPQIALLYSRTTTERYNRSLFSNSQTRRIDGVLTALLDAQLPVEVLSEHHLRDRMSQFPVIVVSQQDTLDPAFRGELLSYARQGGNLVFIGAETTRQFAAELGVSPADSSRQKTRWVRYPGGAVVLMGAALPVTASGQGIRTIGQYYTSEAGEPVAGVVASEVAFGQGKLTAIYTDLSADYRQHQSPKLRDFVAFFVRPLLPRPVVTVTGSHLVHVVPARQQNRLVVNLINTGGRHADPQVFTYDEVPPLTNLIVQIRTDKKPKRIVQQPENRSLPVRFDNGIATVMVPQLPLHSALVVE